MPLGRIVKIGLASLFLAGCATSFGLREKETENLKTQVASLETQLGQLHQTIKELLRRQGDLEAQLAQRPVALSKEQPKKASPLTVRQIQLALKNAGFYQGPIDGKMGPKTLAALKSFQRSEGLTPDGAVGTKTTQALRKLLLEGVE